MPVRRAAAERPLPRPRIAVFAGPTATVLNSHQLITSDKAARKYGLEPILGRDGRHQRFDSLRAQRLARPVTVYVEQFSAHPLEADAAELYAPPDGYLGPDGQFSSDRRSDDDRPVYEVELRPEDGLYLLPYMARQADGTPWDGDAAAPGAPAERSRTPFQPDAARLFEEIDRFAIDDEGQGNLVSGRADFDFYRPAPSGGYRRGLPAARRTDVGEGDIPAEQPGVDYFPYRPPHLRREPPPERLARLTNEVQRALDGDRYAGALWLEGSPFVEETSYWLNLLIDTRRPIACVAGHIGEIGWRNVVDAVDYICSGIWRGPAGDDTVGVVGILDEQIFAARELQKADDRPGGFEATGGHGGIVGTMGKPGPAVLTFRPARRHTAESEVNLHRLPASVRGVRRAPDGSLQQTEIAIRDTAGELRADAIPRVTIVKHARYDVDGDGDGSEQLEILDRLEDDLSRGILGGFVAEGGTPYGHVGPGRDAALRRAVLSGLPVVKVARGNAGGFVPGERMRLAIAGGNLTATKARLLLMACLLRFGALPPAADPGSPTSAELEATAAALARYQAVFDTH